MSQRKLRVRIMKINTIHFIAGLNRGGTEVYLLNLLNFIKSSGGKHTVVAISGGDFLSKFTEAGIEVVILGKNPFKYLSNKSLPEGDVDILHGWLVHGNILAVLFKVFKYKNSKVIWSLRHRIDKFFKFKGLTQVLLIVSTLLTRLVDQIISNSQKGKEDHINLGYPREKIVVIPNGFRTPTSQKQYVNDTAVTSLVTVGRFHYDKGQDVLLKACLALLEKGVDLHCTFVGRGFNDFKKHLPSQFASKFSFTGEVDNPSLYFEKADLFILPSRTEAFPNALGEAMSYGMYCLASDVGDVRYLIGNDDLVFTPDNALALQRSMDSFIQQSNNEKSRIARSLRARIEDQFQMSSSHEKHLSLYSRLLE